MRRLLLLFLIGTCHLSMAADGQSNHARFDWLSISLEHRTRYESLDNRFRLAEVGSDQQIMQRTRLRIGIDRIPGPFSFLFEFQDSRTHLNDSGSTVTNTIENRNDILQIYTSIALWKPGRSNLESRLYIGRHSFDLGSRRLFARNRFRNTTNSFDGFRWNLESKTGWDVTAFLFQPVGRRMHQPDRRDHNSLFWGAFLDTAGLPGVNSEFYYFGIRENLINAQSRKRRFSTVGTRFFRESRPGKISFEVEAAVQFGKRGALDHLAHFQHVSVDYVFRAPLHPKITGRYDYASGDRDPNDDRDGTFDPLFGARSFEYGPTGICGPWYRSNINSPAWQLEATPSKRFTLLSGMRWVWLAQARDQWVGSGLRDVTGKSGTYLGSELEIRLQGNFSKYFRPEAGYARIFKGAYPESVPQSPRALDSNYLYIDFSFFFDYHQTKS